MIRNCLQCQKSFDISENDLDFYEKISPVFGGKQCLIPPPTLCPDCREQRRIAYRVERCLYSRTCDLCQKDILSTYSPDKTHTVYCQKCWWGEGWDPLDYGKEFDFNRPFFDQFRDLYTAVPQLAMQNDNGVTSENCEYCQDFAFGKNCYLVFGSWHIRDSFYDTNCNHVTEVVDCENVGIDSELVYESINCRRIYNCQFLQYSENCNNCFFGYDLKGCQDCFGCFGLRQKQYYIFNQPYSESEYKQKIAALNLGSRTSVEKLKKGFAEVSLKFPRRAMYLQNCDNCRGDSLFNSKDSYGFEASNVDHSQFYYRGDSPVWSYDVHQSGKNQWCYEGVTPDESYMTHFSVWCWKDKYVLYSDNCHSSEYLFGCTGLKKAKYCILNKQYTKEEYEALVPKIVEYMQKTGEWGEFFPVTHSPFAYNETLAQELYPLNKEQVGQHGWAWKELETKTNTPQTYRIPDHIRDVPDTILQELLACEECAKNYKIIRAELAFYRKMNIPVPHRCPTCRHQDRLKQLPSIFKLFKRRCDACQKDIESVYPPERPEKVYCEECYLKNVY